MKAEEGEASGGPGPKARPETLLTSTEKTFLLYAERGDVAGVRRLLERHRNAPEELDVNCADSLRRSALISAIENENVELTRLLLEWNVEVKDALLHAIKEEFVEAVELLLEWEERNHAEGSPYSWEAVDPASAAFTPDVTPLVLAAHVNNYEIVKLLLDRGAALPRPHDVRCGCDECVASSEADSLRHSRARMNAYKALTASSLIALSSEDPLLTAFELSRELRNLSHCEPEFRAEYNEMRAATEDFATALLNHVRTSYELAEVLNFGGEGEAWEAGERQTLERLKLAVKYEQKKFVAHPSVQQLLASMWYDGLPGFRRKSTVRQAVEVLRLACIFPFYGCAYLVAPRSRVGLFVRKPFVKFIFHSSSYAFFLALLGLASQRAEHLAVELFGNEWLRQVLEERRRTERGAWPGAVESILFVYVAGLICGEARALWRAGLREYADDLWNVVDFVTIGFYLAWMSLRFAAIYIFERESRLGRDPYVPREQWHPFDPVLVSEGAFAAGMILSFLKLVHVFSVNPHLGPLQISLGRMIIDILKFFFVYTLVLFAFGCGMNQLMWYYADLEKAKCYGTLGRDEPDFDGNEKACTVWRRFANLFETSQSLFWASFGLVDLTSFELTGMKSFTRFWGLLLFGCYSVVNIIVLLNMLIAMLSNSYQIISERSDVEWKFARSHLWISYFDDGDALPPPFNLLPTVDTLLRAFGVKKASGGTSLKVKSRMAARERHRAVTNNLIARYVTAEQRKRDEFGITEDDVIEIRHDISTLRYELMHVFRTNGMKTPETRVGDGNLVSRKGKVMERRLAKDFQIAVVEGMARRAFAVGGAGGKEASFRAKGSRKKDWNALVREAREGREGRNPIGTAGERRKRLAGRSSRRHVQGGWANSDSEGASDPSPRITSGESNADGIDPDEKGKAEGQEGLEGGGPSKESKSPDEKSLGKTKGSPTPTFEPTAEAAEDSRFRKVSEGGRGPTSASAGGKPEGAGRTERTSGEERDDGKEATGTEEEPRKAEGRSKVTGETLSGWL